MYYLFEAKLLVDGTYDTTILHSMVFHTYSDKGKPKCHVQSLRFAFGYAGTTHIFTNLGYYRTFVNVHVEVSEFGIGLIFDAHLPVHLPVPVLALAAVVEGGEVTQPLAPASHC